MDASKLRNSCICGNTRPYLECCGPFAEPPGAGVQPAGRSPDSEPGGPAAAEADDRPGTTSRAGEGAAPAAFRVGAGAAEPDPEALRYAFRHSLHELSMALFPLRALYQAYWEKLGKEDYPHDLLMEDPDYGRAVLEDFFWDYFVQYSDARPILRTAREIEGKDLRLAHDLMQWSYAPLWFYQVEERGPDEARLRNLGNGKAHRVRHADRLPEAGCGVLTRLLPFRGREFCGHAVLAFDPALPRERLEALFRAGCRELKVKPSVTMRPDVHCEEWRRHGSVFLALWRAETYDARVGRPSGGASSKAATAPPLEAGVPDPQGLAAALGALGPDVRPAGANQWELRYRALRLGRLELKGAPAAGREAGGKAARLVATPTDPGFRGYLRDWLSANLRRHADPAEAEAADPIPGEGTAELDLWVHTPLDGLNGQSPIQASTHDWGRRRLQLLLKDMTKQGRDVTSLRRQLGL